MDRRMDLVIRKQEMSEIKGSSVIGILFLGFYLYSGTTANVGDVVLSPKVVCYFFHYRWYREGAKFSPENVNASSCTHLVYAFAALDDDKLSPTSYDRRVDIDNGFYEKITAFKNQGVKVLLNIGGWLDSTEKWSRLLSDQGRRTRFIHNTICYLNQHGFQGLVLDWEYPKCWQNNCNAGPASDKANYAALVSELKSNFEGFKFELAALIPQWGNLIDAGYDIPTLSDNLDWIGVINFYATSIDDSVTGSDSPLYSSVKSVDNTLINLVSLGADPAKLIVSFPFFGRSYTLKNPRINGFGAPTSGPGLAGDYSKESGTLTYFEVCLNIVKKRWIVRNSEAFNSIAVRGNQWVSFLGREDIIRRAQFVKNGGFGGAMVWDISSDDFMNVCNSGVYPLLTALNNELYS